jgi:hypothetical protein
MLLIMLLFFPATIIQAENSNPLDDMLAPSGLTDSTEVEENVTNDIIRVDYARKNASLAMLMSALVPGSGQFYANKSAITTYIFPVIELALFGGIIYYDNQGDKLTKDYKKYAKDIVTLDINGHSYTGPRYNREFQTVTEDFLIGYRTWDIYDNLYFSLDDKYTQHFYEDIGKYNKYIFGWVDWYGTYADPTLLDPSNWPDDYTGFSPSFIYELNVNDPANQIIDNTWAENYVYGSTTEHYKPSSDLRKAYIELRQDSEDKYRLAHYISFGVAFNHILSAIDAYRVTSKVNRFYLSSNNLKMNYCAAIVNGNVTPLLALSYKF